MYIQYYTYESAEIPAALVFDQESEDMYIVPFVFLLQHNLFFQDCFDSFVNNKHFVEVLLQTIFAQNAKFVEFVENCVHTLKGANV